LRQKLREIDGARAMADYRAQQQAEPDKTARLKAARLARDKAAQIEGPAAPIIPAAKRMGKTAR
jgi:hypothetical protein